MGIVQYRRRSPKQTPLYNAVREGWPEFLAHCENAQQHLPDFITTEFDSYLGCGILENGFARVHCGGCGYDRLVPFSCKGRGFCPSCFGRFMAEKTAHLADNVLPRAAYRQWVLTLPPPLRYLLAYNSPLCSAVLRCFTLALFAHLRRRAKAEFGLSSVKLAHPAAVTAIQRAGSSLNLNVHFHTIALDGVYIQESDSGSLSFRALPPPIDAEVSAVAWDTCKRVVAELRKRDMWLDADSTDDTFAQEQPALAALSGASVRGTLVLGPNAGKRALRLFGQAANDDPGPRVQQTPGYGFNLHAKRRVSKGDRHGLERLCRYILRPPLSGERLRKLHDGRFTLRLKRAWSDGTTHLLLSPLELVQRLVPLVFAPKTHRLRYHGLFAPNAKLRAKVVPAPKADFADESCDSHQGEEGTTPKGSRQRYDWARLMARVFELDVLQCPKCSSQMQRIAFITTKDAIDKILRAVGYAADSPGAQMTHHREAPQPTAQLVLPIGA